MKLAIIGATGLVGKEILAIIAERKFPFEILLMVASESSVNKKINFQDNEYTLLSIEEAVKKKPDIAIFSAGSDVSLAWAPQFADEGTIVIDNSSAWRMHPAYKLIVPEINAKNLRIDDRIIANPNCSTIQMVLALAPLHKRYQLKRIVVSTYQAVSGTGKSAVDQMMAERSNQKIEKVYPYQIDLNLIPHIDIFSEDGYSREETKIINETKKILGDDSIQITATAVRVPVMRSHSEAVNVEFKKEFELEEIRNILRATPGIIVEDDINNLKYPMPITAQHKDEVFVGRLRRDNTQSKTLNMWVVCDNLRKGAATNAVQIAEYLIAHNLVF